MAQISIILPIWNGENYIKDFVKSLDNLKFDFNLIIIDGGSQDNTINELRKELRGFNYSIHVQNNDKKIYGAMNQAIEIVETEFVSFYGIDDRFLPSFNQMFASILKKKGNMIYGGYYNIRKRKRFLHKFRKWHLLFRNICHQAIIYKTCELKKFKYQERYKVQADHYLNIQFFSQVDKILFHNDIVCNYDGGGFSSRNNDDIFQNEFVSIIKSNFGELYGFLARVKKFLVKLTK